MHIGLDARILAHPKRGIQTYLMNLVEKFCNIGGLEVSLFTDKPIRREYSKVCDRAKTIIFGQRHRKCWAQFRLPQQLKKYKIDVYHAVWNNAVPLFSLCPSVVTIHDLIPWNVKGYFTRFKKKLKYKCQEFSSAHRAAAIITNSNYSKRDILRHLRVPQEKVKVIYYGLEPIFKSRPEMEAIRECRYRYGLKRNYIINGGGSGVIEPRRNVETLLRAFHRLVMNNDIDLELAIVGAIDNSHPRYLRLKEIVRQMKIERRVKFVGHLSQEEQFLLLSGARIMVLISLYEGFGLSLIEAMACSVPAIASNVTSIPEIAQNAAILINPHSQEEIASALNKVYSDSQLQARLVEKGLRRIEEFSWEKAANETLSVYRKAIEK